MTFYLSTSWRDDRLLCHILEQLAWVFFFLSPCTMDQISFRGSQPDVEPQVQQPSPQHPEASSLISIWIFGLQTIWSSSTHMRFLALVLMHYYDIFG